MKWTSDSADTYVSGPYSIRRHKSGLRGSMVCWILYVGSDRFGEFPRFTDAKVAACTLHESTQQP